MLLVLFYGLVKGAREIIKKKALEKNTVLEVLFCYTLLGFLFLIPDAKEAFSVDFSEMPWIALKSFSIFIAWTLSFSAIRELPVSLYGIIDLSRVLFAYLFGLFILGEDLTANQMIGMPLVILGLLLLKFLKTGRIRKNSGSDNVSGIRETETIRPKYVIYTLISCILNAFSGLMDKLLMRDGTLSSGTLQFWYMLILLLMYTAYILIRRAKINFRTVIKNYWILILSVIFILGDRALFIANSYPDSKVTVMTLLKQSACFVTIILGRLVFKEKDIAKKLICAAVVLAGIIIAIL